MTINPFKLERYFARHEFSAKYLLSSSDCESLLLSDLLNMASTENLNLWQNLKLGYTESAGHPILRKDISDGYTKISDENIMVAAPEEAIFVAIHTLLMPGDHVIAISPAYQSLHEISKSIGCNLTIWELEQDQNSWTINLDKLEASFTEHTRLMILNFPNNPTGYIPSLEEFNSVIKLAQEKGVYIFCDEMYRMLELDPELRLPSICEVYEKGIALSGMSKSFALPGLRIGWLATQEKAIIENLIRFKDYTTICNSAPSEILAIIALQNQEQILARNLRIIRENINLADKFFKKYQDFVDWKSPKAGSIAFPKWLGKGTVDEFCGSVLEKQGIMIVPGSLFDYPGSNFRIGLGRKNFGEALEHLDEFFSTE